MSEFKQPTIENSNDRPLRQNGPTLAEFVAAGFHASEYPPPGYAVREELPPGVTVIQPVVDNSGKTDELSRAVADAARVVVQEAAPVNRDPAKFKLDYVYNGEMIHESYTTVRGALSRIASLRRLGIVPDTSTAE